MAIKRPKRQSRAGMPPLKSCPNCFMIHGSAQRVCDACGHDFKVMTKAMYAETAEAFKKWGDAETERTMDRVTMKALDESFPKGEA